MELKKIVEFEKTIQVNKVEQYLWTKQNVYSIVSTLEILSHLKAIKKQDIKEIRQLFTNILDKNKNFLNIGLADKNGDILVSPITPRGKNNVSDRLYFKRSMATKKLSIGEFAISRTTGAPTIT